MIKPYIMLNTTLRTAANNDFEKGFFKLMKNRIFGKTMESIRNHKDMKLVASQEKYLKHVMKPSIKGGRPFSKELFALEIGKTDVEMIKAVYLCKAISE